MESLVTFGLAVAILCPYQLVPRGTLWEREQFLGTFVISLKLPRAPEARNPENSSCLNFNGELLRQCIW